MQNLRLRERDDVAIEDVMRNAGGLDGGVDLRIVSLVVEERDRLG